MNRKSATLFFMLFTAVLFLAGPSTAAENNATMTINRFVTCRNVVDREPLGISEVFPADADKVFAFLEAHDISADVTINFVWLYQDNEVASVPLDLRQGSRWRTFSSKKIAGRSGNWRVELRDNGGNVLISKDFTVE